ncbi:MAG TPA: response regulator [Kofleriaceae bacterium]|nr:response regulator [Kofleriaceae bacterium]
MAPGAVLFVDDDADLRELMREVLLRLGVPEVTGASLLGEVQARRDEALACDLAMLDINLGRDQPTGVNVYDWLRREGFAGRIVFLTGHAASDPRVREAAALDGARIMSKPLTVAELGRLLEEGRPAT